MTVLLAIWFYLFNQPTDMIDLYLHNTLHNKRQLFQPQSPDKVTMYVCGPTVYGPIHVGNARPAVVFDVLYRLLKRRYSHVVYARNVTDIDDKIIAAAQQNNESITTLTQRWHQSYQENLLALQVLPPNYEPLATEYIVPMIHMIEQLLKKGFAYNNNGQVLFHVPAFSEYGQLSNRNRQDMIDGARVEINEDKKDAADFVLWKPSDDTTPGWDSPWGRGRPGWHIECSAMAAHCLGKEIDIHGGGQDLIFPHHENELAQSRCCHESDVFAYYWLHNGHVRMEGEKMSKSLNNVLTVNSALEQFSGECIRLALLSTHYRRPMNWTRSAIIEAKTILDRWYRLIDGDIAKTATIASDIELALCDDINTPAAIRVLHQIAQAISNANNPTDIALLRGQFVASAQTLGLLYCSSQAWFHQGTSMTLSESQIEDYIAQRLEAKQEKDFKKADAIRDKLLSNGIILEDITGGKTLWRLK